MLSDHDHSIISQYQAEYRALSSTTCWPLTTDPDP